MAEGIEIYFDQHYSELLDAPERCPICHRHLHLTTHVAAHTGPNQETEVVFECAHSDCRRYFIQRYVEQKFSEQLPFTPAREPFSQRLHKLTPRFQPLFDQAMIAKAHGLTEVVGMALRKALEIFLKDWLSAQVSAAGDKEAIRKERLFNTVARLKTDTSLGVGAHEIADLARLVGNDETHLDRVQQDLGQTNLEEMLRILVGRAEIQLRTLEYQKRHQTGPTPQGTP